MSRFRRRRYLVHDLQYRLLGSTLLYFLILFATAAIIVFAPFVWKMGDGDPTGTESLDVALALLSLHSHFWPLFLALLVIVIGHSILISHRIGGPLFKLKGLFKAINEGDLSQTVRFRRRDYLKEEERTLNEMLDSLRSRLRAIQQGVLEIEDTLERLEKVDDPGSLRSNAEQFNRQILALRKAVDFFNTGTPREVPGSDPPFPPEGSN